MKKRYVWLIFVGLVVLAGFFALMTGSNSSGGAAPILPERAVIELPLAGPLSSQDAEISGLAWMDESTLVFLPQYPNFDDKSNDGNLYYLKKDAINSYLDGRNQSPLEPMPIRLIAPDLEDLIQNYQGFEAIGFEGPRVYMTIEAGLGADMHGYLLSGVVSPDRSVILLDTSRIAEISLDAKSENHADEALVILDGKVITFFETNGKLIVSKPSAHVFSLDLEPLGSISMPNIEYRITDVAAISGNDFWGINYFFPGDTDLKPLTDPIADQYGRGRSQESHEQVERIVKMEYSGEGILLADASPVSLTLVDDARNWEGLAVLDDRGFLLATDKYPSTLFGFVPLQ